MIDVPGLSGAYTTSVEVRFVFKILLAYSLAILPSLFASSASGDTIELKTGERVEGAFKQADSAGVVIEVAGQSITIPLEKVQAIYFGAAPARPVAGPAPSQEALDTLKALRSVTGSGITLREYATRVLDARVKVDRYLSSPGSEGNGLRRSIRAAMLQYELAYRAWQANIEEWNMGLWKTMGETMQDPDVARCPAVRAVTVRVDNPRPQPLPTRSTRSATSSPPDRATTLGLELTNIGGDSLAPGIWACASVQVAEAEGLVATAGSRSSPSTTSAASDQASEQADPNSASVEAVRAAVAMLNGMGHVLTPMQVQMIQRGQASRCSVVTVPPGAEIEVDGIKAGISPTEFVLSKQGNNPRKLTIKMSGYRTLEKAVTPNGQAIPIGLILEKQ